MRNKSKIFTTKQKLRLSVYRSNKHIYAQIIDDSKRRTLVSANSLQISKKSKQKIDKKEQAAKVGERLAKTAKKVKLLQVVFDRGRYRFHGRVAQLAKGARKGGLKF